MSILIVQGPHSAALADPPGDCAGHPLLTCRCHDLTALTHALSDIDRRAVQWVVLDPGRLPEWIEPAQANALREALDALPSPYIELHTEASRELEPWLHPRHAPQAVIVTPRDSARGYALSLRIAARRLADAA